MTRRALVTAALLASVAVASGCAGEDGSGDGSADGSSTSGSRAAGSTCADLVVLGVRGSTQSADRNLGVGTEVRRTVEQLVRRLHARSGTTVRLEAVRYDASATSTLAAYEAHVAAGADLVTHHLSDLGRACPDSRFALVGFSQGAQVVHAAATDVAATDARRISLVAMIADPRHDPHDAIIQWGYASSPVAGNGRLGSGRPIDRDLRPVAISLCVEGDEICNDRGAPGGPPSATHRSFYQKASSARATAVQLDRVLQHNGV